MIVINQKNGCCGCNACVQVCPKQCIKMQTDEEGFWYPSVEEINCINCNRCNAVCPVLNAEKINFNQPENVKAYLAYCKEEKIRLTSSSGGIFTVLAKSVLSKNGVVFGCAFDNNFLAHHITIEREEDLSLLRGSKYLQSSIDNTYKETKEALENGREVLFTGTACQIGGLRGYLGKDYPNLYTADVLCHGTPSPRVWKLYLEEQERIHGAPVRRTFFRSKKYGWKTYAVSLDFANDTAYERIFKQDSFMKLFLSDICLRPSCYDCKFKGMDRPSDITIGDAWGVERHSPEMDDDKGCSVVLLHNGKGEALFDRIAGEVIRKGRDLDTALPPTADSRKSVKPHKNRSKFFKLLRRNVSVKSLTRLTEISLYKRILFKFKKIISKIKK